MGLKSDLANYMLDNNIIIMAEYDNFLKPDLVDEKYWIPFLQETVEKLEKDNTSNKDLINYAKEELNKIHLDYLDTLEHKGYIAQIDEENYDNPKEVLVQIYENKEDFENKEYLDIVSLNKENLIENIYQYIDEFLPTLGNLEAKQENFKYIDFEEEIEIDDVKNTIELYFDNPETLFNLPEPLENDDDSVKGFLSLSLDKNNISINLVCCKNDGPRVEYTYIPNEQEKNLLIHKIDEYCKDYYELSLDEFIKETIEEKESEEL